MTLEIKNNSVLFNKSLSGSAVPSRFLWQNIIIEKRGSVGWISRMYSGSILDEFLKLLSAPVR